MTSFTRLLATLPRLASRLLLIARFASRLTSAGFIRLSRALIRRALAARAVIAFLSAGLARPLLPAAAQVTRLATFGIRLPASFARCRRLALLVLCIVVPHFRDS